MKTKDSIQAAQVVVQRRWIVDCLACRTGVETENGPLESAAEAADAKARHLAEHDRGEYA